MELIFKLYENVQCHILCCLYHFQKYWKALKCSRNFVVKLEDFELFKESCGQILKLKKESSVCCQSYLKLPFKLQKPSYHCY